jgi:PHYB activation tagged suppressor 1
MIKNREKAAMEGKWGDFGSDFLGILLLAHHETDKAKRISVEDIIDECKTFYFAGHETTRTSLTWIVLLLAFHTDWQDKARREVLELFGMQNPNPEGITKLKTVSMT